jgi:sugar lactone lactonase YvrE
MLRIELLIDAQALLGEGPLWDVGEQRLYWIDSLGARSTRATPEAAPSERGTCRAHRLFGSARRRWGNRIPS